jgi:ligand-binding sensor domain-containing protein
MLAKISPGPMRGHRIFVRRLLAVLCAGGWAAPAAAQIDPPHRPIRFERSEIEPFLPQSTVYAVHQDRQGFLWFATREGLGRWDGYEMRTWKAEPFRTNALPNNVVRRMVEDGEGNLWVVVVPDNYEPTRLSRLPGPGHESVETLPLSDAIPFVDSAGIAWVADRDSLYRYDRGAGRLTAVRARIGAPALATAGLVDRAGIVWLGSEGGVLERYDLTRSDARRIDPVEPWHPGAESGLVAGLFEDSRGTIWVSGV